MVHEKHGYEKHPTMLGKAWHFLAHEDSILSFVVDAILVIIIGKFIVLPLIGLMLGTLFPIVAVVSGSMDHHGNSFESWWFQNGAGYMNNQNISEAQFKQFPNVNGFSKGDVFIVTGAKLSDVKIGDVIVYNIPGQIDPIIHRVIAKTNSSLATKGDANTGQLSFESSVSASQLRGIARYKIPYLGWFKVGLMDLVNLAKR